MYSLAQIMRIILDDVKKEIIYMYVIKSIFHRFGVYEKTVFQNDQ